MNVFQYFVGKPCTIFTVANNRKLTEEQSTDYFVGIVESIDQYGVLTRHFHDNHKTFYPMCNVVAISEEEIISDEEAKKRMEAVAVQQKKPAGAFQDYKALAGLSEQAKQLSQKPAPSTKT